MTISIVREQESKFDEHGHCVSTEAMYVKISVSFRDMMQVLKGARLSAFLALALNEAEMSLGQSGGLTVYQIAESTGYGVRATIYALQFLCEGNFATKLEQCGEHGESVYRVSAYAWFGESRAQLPVSNRRYAKNAHLVANCIGVQKETSVVVVPDRCLAASSAIGVEQQQTTTGARELFAGLRVGEPALSRLSRAVSLENAEAWCDWTREAPGSFRDPVAYMVKRLSEDPRAEAPAVKRKHWWGDEYDQFINR